MLGGFSKGRSGVSGKAYIEGCFIVSRGNVGMLLWAERHPRGMPLGQWFGVIHCEALLVAPAEASKRSPRPSKPIPAARHLRSPDAGMEAPGLTSLGKTCSLDGLANVEVYSLMMSFLGQLAARRLDTLPRGGRRRA
jgi:hypothetical protein